MKVTVERDQETGQFVVVIPEEIANDANLIIGDLVEIETQEPGVAVLRRISA